MRQDEILELIQLHNGGRRAPEGIKIISDTTDFFKVGYQDVILLGEAPFWIKRYEKEGRFGLDDEPKYWVRRAIDLRDGSTKIIKLVFHEEFVSRIGELSFVCFRSPRKESRILRLVAEHPNFMHGEGIPDQAGNEVRVLEFISILPEPEEDFFPSDEARLSWRADKKRQMETVLTSYRDILLSAGFAEEQVVSRLVIRACPSVADAILEEQARLRSCIVVVGRRGISHHEEFVFGSTSSKILHQAKNCAVLVVE